MQGRSAGSTGGPQEGLLGGQRDAGPGAVELQVGSDLVWTNTQPPTGHITDPVTCLW
jgi:hypothetical protein